MEVGWPEGGLLIVKCLLIGSNLGMAIVLHDSTFDARLVRDSISGLGIKEHPEEIVNYALKA